MISAISFLSSDSKSDSEYKFPPMPRTMPLERQIAIGGSDYCETHLEQINPNKNKVTSIAPNSVVDDASKIDNCTASKPDSFEPLKIDEDLEYNCTMCEKYEKYEKYELECNCAASPYSLEDESNYLSSDDDDSDDDTYDGFHANCYCKTLH
jgi:hypothetical protein